MEQNGFKYFVLKAEEFLESLIDDDEATFFNEMLQGYGRYRLENGKTKANSYYIVNRDEPWADEVRAVMEKHLGPLAMSADE